MTLPKRLLIVIGALALIVVGVSVVRNRTLSSDPLPETISTTAATPPAPTTVSLPTPTPTGALHPMSIDALRAGSYPGSDLVIEQTLDPGVNYDRYVASYQSDGLKIYALLTIPRDPKPPTGYPAIVFNHGYIPPDVYRTTERYVAYVDAFARNGYVVIKPDYRGHGDSEGTAGSAYGHHGYVTDVLNALASIRRRPDVDAARVGMWGHSMGGYITLRAMVANQDIRAGVIWAGVVLSYPDMFTRWFRGGSGGGNSWRNQMVTRYGSPESNPAFWNSLSANSYLADLSGPIQIHHGTGDTTVPYDFSTTLEAEIRAAGKPVELFLYDGDDHNIAANRDDALTLSVVFFNQHVKGLYE